jgi:hypothetical protein
VDGVRIPSRLHHDTLVDRDVPQSEEGKKWMVMKARIRNVRLGHTRIRLSVFAHPTISELALQ